MDLSSLQITILIIIKISHGVQYLSVVIHQIGRFITKPAEMSKKWKKENEGTVEFKLQDTDTP